MRANIFYDKLQAPPEPGSLQEVVCMMVYQSRQQQEVAKVLVLIAEPANKKQAVEFYQQTLAPYVQIDKDHEANVNAARMSRYLGQGPIIIKLDE